MRALAAVEQGVLDLVEVSVPEPDDYEVLVKNEGCVFCNSTDKMIIDQAFATPAYPVVIGHEGFGTVIKVGKKVKKYRLGDRVICANAIVNGFDGTYYSAWGGFAEYGIAGDLEAYLQDGNPLDDANKYRKRYAANEIIPKDLSMEQAALAFPLAEAASSVRQVGDLTGKTVAVIGTGIVGYFFTYFAKVYGAKTVVALGRRESRLEVSRKVGADATFIDVGQATEFLKQMGGADVVFECSGNWQALENGLPYLKKGGTLAVYGVPTKPYSIHLLKCPTEFSYKRVDPQVHGVMDEVCGLLAQNRVPVDVFLTHRWTLDQAPEAFEEVRKGNVIKGMVVME